MKNIVKKITLERLKSTDCYRAQVNLPNKMTWAAGYNAVYDFNPELAGVLRDQLGARIEAHLIEHLKTLIASSGEFREFYTQWLGKNVDATVVPKLRFWLLQHGLTM